MWLHSRDSFELVAVFVQRNFFKLIKIVNIILVIILCYCNCYLYKTNDSKNYRLFIYFHMECSRISSEYLSLRL